MMTRISLRQGIVQLCISIFLICLNVIPVSAQSDTEIHFATDDQVVHFDYPDIWTMEVQSRTFNQVYRFELWTYSSPIAPFLTNKDRSRILLEIINPLTSDYPQMLTSPQDYAEFLIVGTSLISIDDQIAGYPAVRIIPDVSTMPTQAPLMWSENFGTPVPVTPMGGGNESFDSVIYVIVRDDGWIMRADLAAPPAEFSSAETMMLNMLESLTFDAHVAAIPFERNLPVYDVSNIRLDRSFTNDDLLFSLQYPSAWETGDFKTRGEPPFIFALSFVDPSVDAMINFLVVDTTSGEMGLPLDLNSPQELIRGARQANPAVIGSGTLLEISEFRTTKHEAISIFAEIESQVSLTVIVALNDTWVVMALVQVNESEVLDKLEPEIVAALETIRFAFGGPYIISPVLSVELPEPWVVTNYTNQQGDYYKFNLHYHGDAIPSGRVISIEMINLGAYSDLYSRYQEIGLAGLIEMVATGLGDQLEGETQHRSINGHEVVLVHSHDESQSYYFDWNALILNETWLVILEGGASSQEALYPVLDVIDQIIERAEFTFPEEAP